MKFITRLLVIVAVVVIAFVGVSVLGTQIVRRTQSIDELSTKLDRLSADTWRLQSLTFEIQVTSNFDTVIPEWRAISGELRNQLEAIVASREAVRVAAASDEFQSVLSRMSSLIDLVERELDRFEGVLAEFTDGFTAYPAYTIAQLLDERQDFSVLRVRTAGTSMAGYLDDTLQGMIDQAVEQLAQARTDAVRFLLLIFFAVVGLTSAIVVITILLFMRSLRRRFAGIADGMGSLSEGDLTIEFDASGNDELSDLSGQIQAYVDEFSRVVAGIKEIVDSASMLRADLVSASEESAASVTQIGGNIGSISSTIEDLDRTLEQTGGKLEEINLSIRELEAQIEKQSHSVEESSSAVEQMAASVNSVSRIAADRQGASERLKNVTREGHSNIESTDEKVAAIADSVEETLGIITVINTIASQTSILSMNAAIEAAHAGEYGRGFSVVAAEIRRLSESTNENAKRIKAQLQRVAELATDTRQMSATTRESFLSVENEVETTAAALSEISATMRELAQGTESVLSATSEAGQVTHSIRNDATTVASRSEDITRDMHHVREISASVRGGIQEIGVGTQEINEMVANVSSVTREMTDQVDLLGESVSRFKTTPSVDASGASLAGDITSHAEGEDDAHDENGSSDGAFDLSPEAEEAEEAKEAVTR